MIEVDIELIYYTIIYINTENIADEPSFQAIHSELPESYWFFVEDVPADKRDRLIVGASFMHRKFYLIDKWGNKTKTSRLEF